MARLHTTHQLPFAGWTELGVTRMSRGTVGRRGGLSPARATRLVLTRPRSGWRQPAARVPTDNDKAGIG